jgi:hypothetical protein
MAQPFFREPLDGRRVRAHGDQPARTATTQEERRRPVSLANSWLFVWAVYRWVGGARVEWQHAIHR